MVVSEQTYELHVYKDYRPWWKLGAVHHKCMVWQKSFDPKDFVAEISDLRAAIAETGWSLDVLPA